jgi:hypothetical protein
VDASHGVLAVAAKVMPLNHALKAITLPLP